MNSSQAKALVYYMFAALGGNVKGQMALVIINNFSIINGISQHSQDLSIYMRLAIPVSPAGIPSQAGLVQQQQQQQVPLLLLHLCREFYLF